MSTSSESLEPDSTLQNGINGNSRDDDAAIDGPDDAVDGDLFGEGSDADQDGWVPCRASSVVSADGFHSKAEGSPKRRKLDDEDLDSGDDDGRHDRLENGYGEDEEQGEPHEENVADVRLPRHAIPRPSDGEVMLPSDAPAIFLSNRRSALSFSNAQTTRYRAKAVPPQHFSTANNRPSLGRSTLVHILHLSNCNQHGPMALLTY